MALHVTSESSQPLRDQKSNGGFKGLLILTSILIICIIIVIR
jgi:hypothetical protein